MADLKIPSPGKAIVGIITQALDIVDSAQRLLEKKLGSIEHKSPVIDFDFTDYYEAEMGKNLLRLWIGFDQPIALARLTEMKLWTMEIENEFLDTNRRRRINLDPGILTLAKLVLATTKNYYHRIYLGKGIFAEVTLIYRNKQFEPLAWTYPDYRTDTAIDFFQQVRNDLLQTGLLETFTTTEQDYVK